VKFRRPLATDAARVAALVEKTGVLDVNSPYAYLLLCTDFAQTGAVAEEAGEVVGFVLGYRPPGRPEAYFVWQVAVSEDQRGCGLAGRMVEWIVAGLVADGVRFLEATVTPSNRASWSLFEGFARRAGAPFRHGPGFASDLFPDADHEEELRIRIGPFAEGALDSRGE
jgi:L-2,4-diaminobutyric acid acetyltransferase